MNYIKHLNGVSHNFYSDPRLHPAHISLYMALFFYWNLHHFPIEFYANRIELMKMAKIGSRSTYHRLIKELSNWEYITYLPTQNPTQKTIVRMSHIDTINSTVLGQTSSLLEHYCPKNVPLTLYIKHSNKTKLSMKRKPKNDLEVLEFFKSKKWSAMDAKKFYNHYEGVGWKIGGKVAIEDWQAIAENWILKANELANRSGIKVISNREDFLIINDQKNYGQPL